MRLFFVLLLVCQALASISQEKVTFYASDSLKITADLYYLGNDYPFILLFHQAESSRGEYKLIAPKLKNMGFNCLAVDLRSGRKSNYVKNETADRARQKKIPSKYIDSQQDINAAIEYVKKYNRKAVILFGSSYSASLVLLKAAKTSNIRAVVAFSPGEYFQPELEVKPHLKNIDIPVFIASSELEYNYIVDLASGIDEKRKTIYKPQKGRGVHGAKALWEENPDSKECWFQLSFFFDKLNN
jgi:dienelactone hydrolase